MGNLYEQPLDGAKFTTCGGNLGGEHETCAALAKIPGTTGFVIQDTKTEGKGRELRFTQSEMDALVSSYEAVKAEV
ncbi:DUF397 domain-containing protein [Streptomyces sp. NPDC051561]|uniref:DUF397 domain-containing protein n=1 Tax=Streptomyces sp. NPDC051561 TaxID=3365658 RepID=UPI0037B69186